MVACTSGPPTTQFTCPTQLTFPATLVYPQAAAIRVPANVGSIIVQGGFTDKNVSIAVTAVESPGLVVQAPLGPPPVPLPSPLATPPGFAGYPLGSIKIPVLANLTQYGVLMIETFPDNPTCSGISVPLGGFTTAF